MMRAITIAPQKSRKQVFIYEVISILMGLFLSAIIHVVFYKSESIRRMHIYYLQYIFVFFGLLSILFIVVNIFLRERHSGGIFFILFSGALCGYVSGVISYTFVVGLNIFSINPSVAIFRRDFKDLTPTVLTIVTFPLIALQSWVYGLIFSVVSNGIFNALAYQIPRALSLMQTTKSDGAG
jgi:hypothetical protein